MRFSISCLRTKARTIPWLRCLTQLLMQQDRAALPIVIISIVSVPMVAVRLVALIAAAGRNVADHQAGAIGAIEPEADIRAVHVGRAHRHVLAAARIST